MKPSPGVTSRKDIEGDNQKDVPMWKEKGGGETIWPKMGEQLTPLEQEDL